MFLKIHFIIVYISFLLVLILKCNNMILFSWNLIFFLGEIRSGLAYVVYNIKKITKVIYKGQK